MQPQVARFNVMTHGKFSDESTVSQVSLSDGERVTTAQGGRTDEGYHWRYVTFSYRDGVVTMIVTTDSRDCDGRYDTYHEFECHRMHLRTQPLNAPEYFIKSDRDALMPDWIDVDSCQRDHTAEAAGY